MSSQNIQQGTHEMETILKVPAHTLVHDLPSSILWIDESGIVCSIAKNKVQTLEEAKAALVQLKSILGDQKVCFLSDNTNSLPTNKEMRDYAAEIIPGIAKAIAVLSRSSVGRMTANLFFSLKKQPYPVKFFNDANEAKAWLKQYL